MNYQKLDPSLSMAVNEVEEMKSVNSTQLSTQPRVVVFIHTQSPLDSSALDTLAAIGISDATEARDVYTATLDIDSLSQLSEYDWVKTIKLSQKLHFV